MPNGRSAAEPEGSSSAGLNPEAQPPSAPREWACFAREVIEAVTRDRPAGDVSVPNLPVCPHGGVFVTLHRFNRLRGCMGLLDPATALPEAIRQAAVCAASQDPRFQPLRPPELADLAVEVSILSAPRPLRCLEELELGLHGILVRSGGCRGLFLPQVAIEHHLDKEAFLSRCCAEKAGLPADAWRRPGVEVLIFTTQVCHTEPANRQ